jgi:hypothetical protein
MVSVRVWRSRDFYLLVSMERVCEDEKVKGTYGFGSGYGGSEEAHESGEEDKKLHFVGFEGILHE